MLMHSEKKTALQALESTLSDDAEMSLDDLKKDITEAGFDPEDFVTRFRRSILLHKKGKDIQSTLLPGFPEEDQSIFTTGVSGAFPVREMHKRRWFSNFQGSASDAVEKTHLLLADFFKGWVLSPKAAFLKQLVRAGSEADRYALLAWQCRVLKVAESQQLTKAFDVKLISNEWLRNVAQLSRYDDGPSQVQSILADAGIAFVVEPHLPSTHLDGAALIGKNGPVVGMTLRHDRLDNFWFVLLHELVHVQRHLKLGEVEDIFDDLDSVGKGIEIEADEVAGNALLPNDRWKLAVARYVRSEASVRAFAAQLKVGPAIVAGRIRKEADNWTLLTDLIGQGNVRRHFPSVYFNE